MSDTPANNSILPGQLEQFVERTSAIPEPKTQVTPGGETAKRVPFPTALSAQLTGDQEAAMVAFALARVKQLESELGRDLVLDPNWAGGANPSSTSTDTARKAADSFMGKRARYAQVFANKVDWRAQVFGGIFKESNLVVSLARRIARQSIARAQNYFFSTDPWFTAEPEGVEDNLLAEKIDRYAKFKLRQLGSKKNKERAIKNAFVHGECVVKTAHVTRDQPFKAFANVLIDEADQPILDASGGFIFDTDKWQPETQVDLETGEPNPTGSGVLVLARDGVTPKPSVLLWQSQIVDRRHVLFSGPESLPIYFVDFLCPLTAPDVQQADLVAHLYDKPVMELVDLYVKSGLMADLSPDARQSDAVRLEAIQRTVQLIRDLTQNTSAPKSGANQSARPNDDASATDTADQAREPVAEIAECYLWFDANGDGILENIMLVVDRKNGVPLFYDYVPNVSIDGLRPFEVVRVNEIDGRWYGEGIMEMFEPAQNIVDLLVNRWNQSQSAAGRVTFWRPDLTLEGRANPNLVLNGGSTYTLANGAKPEDALHVVYLNDNKFEAIERMFEFFMQISINESGVQHANDGETAGLDSQKLATGIRNIEKAGQELFAPFLSDLEPALQNILAREILVIFGNLSQPEVFRYFAGDTATGDEIPKLDTITPDEVRDLAVNVTMLLTRYKGEQLLVQNQQASLIVQEFYSLPVEIQPFVVGFYRNQIKAIDPRIDTKRLLQPGIAQIGAQPAVPGAGNANAQRAATRPTNPGQSPVNL